MTTTEVGRRLGIKVGRLLSWIEREMLPLPSVIDSNGVRYFDQEWLRRAQKIAESKRDSYKRLVEKVISSK